MKSRNQASHLKTIISIVKFSAMRIKENANDREEGDGQNK